MLPMQSNSKVNNDVNSLCCVNITNYNTLFRTFFNFKFFSYIFLDSFKKTIEKFGKINIVVNNAGIMTKYLTSWELAIDLNYVSSQVYSPKSCTSYILVLYYTNLFNLTQFTVVLLFINEGYRETTQE